MRLAITHDKYTHVDVRGYRMRQNGTTYYEVLVVPCIVDGMCVTTEAYTGNRTTLGWVKRASKKYEDQARDIASIVVPDMLNNLATKYGFTAPHFDASKLTFTVC